MTSKELEEEISKMSNRITHLVKEVETLKRKINIKAIEKKLSIGDTFDLLGIKWKILDISDGSYKCLAEKLENSMKFDKSSNNWSTSDLREYLNGDFYKKLAEVIGEDNIIPMGRDLLSLDGQTEYGTCEDKVSLINVDEYRKYRSLIPNTGERWWTITPDSTKCNGDDTWVRVVSSSGDFNFDDYINDCGVRPFVSFSSAIFESEE